MRAVLGGLKLQNYPRGAQFHSLTWLRMTSTLGLITYTSRLATYALQINVMWPDGAILLHQVVIFKGVVQLSDRLVSHWHGSAPPCFILVWLNLSTYELCSCTKYCYCDCCCNYPELLISLPPSRS